jgi:hypothetical protein
VLIISSSVRKCAEKTKEEHKGEMEKNKLNYSTFTRTKWRKNTNNLQLNSDFPITGLELVGCKFLFQVEAVSVLTGGKPPPRPHTPHCAAVASETSMLRLFEEVKDFMGGWSDVCKASQKNCLAFVIFIFISYVSFPDRNSVCLFTGIILLILLSIVQAYFFL